jgi:hypothetical protein
MITSSELKSSLDVSHHMTKVGNGNDFWLLAPIFLVLTSRSSNLCSTHDAVRMKLTCNTSPPILLARRRKLWRVQSYRRPRGVLLHILHSVPLLVLPFPNDLLILCFRLNKMKHLSKEIKIKVCVCVGKDFSSVDRDNDS